MRPSPVPRMSPIIVTLGLAGLSFMLALVAYRNVGSVRLAGTMFVPLRLYLLVRPRLRAPGYQDVMDGECLVPACDHIAILLTIVVSGLVYFALATGLIAAYHRRS